jgi:hypothetical protein
VWLQSECGTVVKAQKSLKQFQPDFRFLFPVSPVQVDHAPPGVLTSGGVKRHNAQQNRIETTQQHRSSSSRPTRTNSVDSLITPTPRNTRALPHGEARNTGSTRAQRGRWQSRALRVFKEGQNCWLVSLNITKMDTDFSNETPEEKKLRLGGVLKVVGAVIPAVAPFVPALQPVAAVIGALKK